MVCLKISTFCTIIVFIFRKAIKPFNEDIYLPVKPKPTFSRYIREPTVDKNPTFNVGTIKIDKEDTETNPPKIPIIQDHDYFKGNFKEDTKHNLVDFGTDEIDGCFSNPIKNFNNIQEEALDKVNNATNSSEMNSDLDILKTCIEEVKPENNEFSNMQVELESNDDMIDVQDEITVNDKATDSICKKDDNDFEIGQVVLTKSDVNIPNEMTNFNTIEDIPNNDVVNDSNNLSVVNFEITSVLDITNGNNSPYVQNYELTKIFEDSTQVEKQNQLKNVASKDSLSIDVDIYISDLMNTEDNLNNDKLFNVGEGNNKLLNSPEDFIELDNENLIIPKICLSDWSSVNVSDNIQVPQDDVENFENLLPLDEGKSCVSSNSLDTGYCSNQDDQLSRTPSPELRSPASESLIVYATNAKAQTYNGMNNTSNVETELVHIGTSPSNAYYVNDTTFKKTVKGRNERRQLEQISRTKPVIAIKSKPQQEKSTTAKRGRKPIHIYEDKSTKNKMLCIAYRAKR